jgi:hypothetical protein
MTTRRRQRDDVDETTTRDYIISAREQRTKGGFKTKAEALAAMSKLQVAKADGTFVQPSKVTVAAYLEAWLAGVRGQIRASTYGTYELAARRLKPLIGNVSLQALTRNQVKAPTRHSPRQAGPLAVP